VIEQSQEVSKWAYNHWKQENPSFTVGDLVWLEATNLSMDEPSLKLASKCHGPFKIKEKLSDLTYCLKLLPQWRIHNVFHVNVLSKAKADAILNCCSIPQPPVKVRGDKFWVIKKYVSS
jgi:hypothetical protein